MRIITCEIRYLLGAQLNNFCYNSMFSVLTILIFYAIVDYIGLHKYTSIYQLNKNQTHK